MESSSSSAVMATTGLSESELANFKNPELLRAIQLVEDAFKCQNNDKEKANRLFDRASICFLQAIRTSKAENRQVVRNIVDKYVERIESERTRTEDDGEMQVKKKVFKVASFNEMRRSTVGSSPTPPILAPSTSSPDLIQGGGSIEISLTCTPTHDGLSSSPSSASILSSSPSSSLLSSSPSSPKTPKSKKKATYRKKSHSYIAHSSPRSSTRVIIEMMDPLMEENGFERRCTIKPPSSPVESRANQTEEFETILLEHANHHTTTLTDKVKTRRRGSSSSKGTKKEKKKRKEKEKEKEKEGKGEEHEEGVHVQDREEERKGSLSYLELEEGEERRKREEESLHESIPYLQHNNHHNTHNHNNHCCEVEELIVCVQEEETIIKKKQKKVKQTQKE